MPATANDPNHTLWPFGAVYGDLNKGTVRSGYSYFPELLIPTNVTTSAGSRTVGSLPGHDPKAAEEHQIGPFIESAMDLKRAVILDTLPDQSLSDFSHKNPKGSVAGLNAGFGDGHVSWQNYNPNSDGFNTSLWNDVFNNNGNSLQAIVYSFQ
jgi:prepilin-type processing-associated H-X9-DG protein